MSRRWTSERRPAAWAAVALVLALAAVALQGCRDGPDDGPQPAPERTQTPDGEPGLALEVYGDSLTVADSPSFGAGGTGPQSWVHHLGQHGLQMAAGSGRWGATAGDILDQHLQPPAPVDLLVLFLGTNDLAASDSDDSFAMERHHEDFVATVGRIVERQGYPPDRVVLVAVGPRDWGSAAPVVAWNRLTAQAAGERGWHLVDPWDGLRTEDNRYTDPSLTTDGLHLAEAGAVRLAAGLAAGLRDAAEQAEQAEERTPGPRRLVPGSVTP